MIKIDDENDMNIKQWIADCLSDTTLVIFYEHDEGIRFGQLYGKFALISTDKIHSGK